jgi:hypothetical protein
VTGVPLSLTTGLLRWARATPGMELAVRVLAEGSWLTDPAFVEACVVVVVDGDDHDALAVVDWAAVAELAADRPEGDPAVDRLRIAYELAARSWSGRGPD